MFPFCSSSINLQNLIYHIATNLNRLSQLQLSNIINKIGLASQLQLSNIINTHLPIALARPTGLARYTVTVLRSVVLWPLFKILLHLLFLKNALPRYHVFILSSWAPGLKYLVVVCCSVCCCCWLFQIIGIYYVASPVPLSYMQCDIATFI